MLIKAINPAEEILKDAGIGEAPADKNDLRAILESNGLSLADTVRELSTVAKYSDDEGTKLRALDTAFKLHKVLEDPVKNVPVVNVIIQSTNPNSLNGIATILIPRALESAGQ